jgi:hypothetical protein
MAQIVLDMTADDFQRLTVNSTNWADSWAQSWRGQLIDDGRFEHVSTIRSGAFVPTSNWRVGYWVERDWSHVMLCRAFLASEGHDCEILFDLAGGKQVNEIDGEPIFEGEYVILTDFLSPVWVESAARTARLEAQYKLETGTQVESNQFEGTAELLDFSTADPKGVRVLVRLPEPAEPRIVTLPVNDVWPAGEKD